LPFQGNLLSSPAKLRSGWSTSEVLMERQRHLLTTHLDAIAQRTGLEPGMVHP
jgi:hypothetical protein